MSQINYVARSKGHYGTDCGIPYAYLNRVKPCSHPLSDPLIVFPGECFLYQTHELMSSSIIMYGRNANTIHSITVRMLVEIGKQTAQIQMIINVIKNV